MVFELIAAVLAVGWMSTTWVLVAKINELEEKEKINNKVKDLTNPENLFKYTNNKEAE